MVKRAEFAQQLLLFMLEDLRQLLSDDNFTNLQHVEGLGTLPKYFAEQVRAGGYAT
jgi:ParB family chromosome partitioning protein